MKKNCYVFHNIFYHLVNDTLKHRSFRKNQCKELNEKGLTKEKANLELEVDQFLVGN